MKNLYSLLIAVFFLSFNLSAQTNHNVNAGNFYYTPSNLVINVGDTVTWFNDGGFHDVNGDINSQTGFSFGNPSNFYLSAVQGPALIGSHIFTVAGNYEYDCSIGSHALNGMVGYITVNSPPSLDCNGVVDGPALVDSCGDCQLAYVYNFITHVPTFINDTTGIILGPTEILVMPNDPSNPLWNSSCSGCTDPTALNYDSTATIDNGSCIYVNPSIYDIVVASPDHTLLEIAIDSCGLGGTLSGPGPFTLFAPTDAAFNALPTGTLAALLNDLPLLTNILLHHVVGDSVMSGMLSNGQIVTTLLGTDVTVTINSSGVYIDGAMVTVADVVGDNGVVHVIDAILLPNPGCTDPNALNYDSTAFVDDGSCTYATNTIYDVVVTSNDHNLLEIAIDTCGLGGTLSGIGPFTLFAPTDAAFNALGSGTVLGLLNDVPLLTNILLHHVVGDSVMSGMLTNGQIVTTLLGTDVTVTINTSGVYIDNAMVTVADIVADNGVVHVIDAVLLPNPGCTDPNATNYDSTAIVDDGSCIYATNTVYDVVVTSPDHAVLEVGIDTCGLDAFLSGPGPFTLFAPTDAAFNALGPATLLSLLADLPQLTNILKHHVVGDSVMSGMLTNGQIITTLLGTDVTVTIDPTGVYIDGAMVTVADITADNGVVHVIDAVLIPQPPAGNTVYDIIEASPAHATLKLAIDTTGLTGTLKGPGPFTVFAPTDAAFSALPSGTIAALLNDLPQLTDILKHHVVGDSVMSGMLSNGQIVTTLLGTDLTVTINSTGVYIDNAMVTVADIVGDNGVVHVIDAVLLPSSTGINQVSEVNNQKYLYSINLLGEKVKRNKRKQVVLDVYSNGKVVKRFNP